MSVSLGGGKGRGRYRPLAEINVTPLVDVMLVLLIVFMVAAPLMTSGVPINRISACAPAETRPQRFRSIRAVQEGSPTPPLPSLSCATARRAGRRVA